LPKLPIPELTETLDKYLLCIRPIVSSDQYDRTRQLVDEFQKPGGTGEQLQKRLLEYAKTTDNWVSHTPFNSVCNCYKAKAMCLTLSDLFFTF